MPATPFGGALAEVQLLPVQFKFSAKEAVAATPIEPEPLMDAEAVSVAVSVCVPLVSSVAEN